MVLFSMFLLCFLQEMELAVRKISYVRLWSVSLINLQIRRHLFSSCVASCSSPTLHLCAGKPTASRCISTGTLLLDPSTFPKHSLSCPMFWARSRSSIVLNIMNICLAGTQTNPSRSCCSTWCGPFGQNYPLMVVKQLSLSTCSDTSPSKHLRRKRRSVTYQITG